MSEIEILLIEDYIAQTKKYRERYFPLQRPYGGHSLAEFLAMPYPQSILAVTEVLKNRPPSEELISDYLSWVPREQERIRIYAEKTIPFKGDWSPGGSIIQIDTYTVESIQDSAQFIKVSLETAFNNGSHRVCGYLDSVKDKKRWAFLCNCVDYDGGGQSIKGFLDNAVASITDQDTLYKANINSNAMSYDLQGIPFLRQGTCSAALLRTTDYVDPQYAAISGYRHNWSLIDGADFDGLSRY